MCPDLIAYKIKYISRKAIEKVRSESTAQQYSLHRTLLNAQKKRQGTVHTGTHRYGINGNCCKRLK
jgi:hypothetical protein